MADVSVVVSRCEAYAAFALVFQGPPDPENRRGVREVLQESLGRLEGFDGWDDLASRFEWNPGAGSDAAVEQDYMTLFYGPQKLAAPPYESVYVSGVRQLMGRAAAEVLSAYEKAGFRVKESYRNCPDHVAVELEFMAHLCAREQRQEPGVSLREAETAAVLQREFLGSHLSRWSPAFCADIRRHAATGFWRATARALDWFVRQDCRYMGVARNTGGAP